MSLDVLFWRFYSADYRGGSRRSIEIAKVKDYGVGSGSRLCFRDSVGSHRQG